MLRDSFYTVLKTKQMDLISFRSTVVINKDHEIFKGHFRAVPIVPGVCMLQMVKELLEERIRKPLQLTHSGNIKFLSVINPLETSQIEIEVKCIPVEDGTYHAEASIYINNSPFFKIVKAIYK